jgi:2-oxoglutarate ferredoxin oxidoreductase subunit beta
LLVAAIEHPGFSLVEVIQPCITWGTHPLSWYRERVYKVGEGYDPGDREAALEKTMEWGDKIATGILYRTSPRPLFAARFRKEVAEGPLAELEPLGPERVREILADFRPAG